MEVEEFIINIDDKVQYTVVTVFEYDNNNYIVLLPHNIVNEEEYDISMLLYKYDYQEDKEELSIYPILSNVEYELAEKKLETLMNDKFDKNKKDVYY